MAFEAFPPHLSTEADVEQGWGGLAPSRATELVTLLMLPHKL